ncbi:C3H1-type domain-containing protein, partial [Durusdinium trenchii]
CIAASSDWAMGVVIMSHGSEADSPSNVDSLLDSSRLEATPISPPGILHLPWPTGARVSIPPVAEFRQAQHIIFDTADVSSNESEDDDVLEDQTVPSVGSLDHGGAAGCRPCAFFMSSTGCRNGVDCNFCHLDHSPSERQLPKPSSRPAKGKRDK